MLRLLHDVGVQGDPSDALCDLGLDSLELLTIGEALRKRGFDVADADLIECNTVESLETCVRDSLRRVLDSVGVHGDETDGLMDLGFDSLSLMELGTALRGQGFDVSDADLLECDTVGCLVERMHHRLPERAGTPVGATFSSCTSNQRQLLMHFEAHPESMAYVIDLSHRVYGEVDVCALAQAIRDVQERHSALRTVFERDDERGYACRVIPAPSVSTNGDVDATPFALLDGDLPFRAATRAFDGGVDIGMLVHHIAFDGASYKILFDDLERCYSQRVRASAPPPPLRTDVQQAILAREGAPMDDAVAYWKTAGAGLPVLELPWDGARVARAEKRWGVARTPLLTAHERGRFGTRTLTDFQAMLSVWALVLLRHTEQTSITITTPTQNRQGLEAGHVGYMANLVSVHLALEPEVSLVAFGETVRRHIAAALRHGHVPFHRQTHSDPAAYETWFRWRSDYSSLRLGDDVRTERHPVLTRTHARCDVDMCVFDDPSDRSVIGELEINTSVLSVQSAQSILERLRSSVRALLGVDWHGVRDAVALPSTEMARMRAFSCTHAVDAQLTVDAMVHAHVRRHPTRTALTFDDASWTYADLWEFVERVVGVLSDRNMIGLQIARSVEQVVAFLAVFRFGAAVLCLDDAWPEDRRRVVLEDADCVQLLVHARTHARALSLVPDAICVDAVAAVCALPTDEVRHLPTDFAYVIYTSGSTGKPKGIMVEHRTLTHVLQGEVVAMRYADVPWDAWYTGLTTAYTFDMFHMHLFCTLGVLGGRVRLLPDSTALADGTDLSGLTHVGDVPSIVALATLPASVRHVTVAGEAVTLSTVDAVRDAHLYNDYGVSETHVITTSEVDRAQPDLKSIGRPCSNSRCYVFQQSRIGAFQPLGVWGELWIGGATVARGYLRRDDLTRERFVAWRDDRVYCTGDRVKWRADGAFDYGGRFDFQVKLRGQRVELGEVEAAFYRFVPCAKEVVAVVQHKGTPRARLVVFVQSTTTACGVHRVDKIAPGVRDVLPSVMVPACVVVVEDWERQPGSSKIYRRALETMDVAVPETEAASAVAPRTSAETVVRDAFASLLGHDVEDVGVETRFVDLGGNSVSAVLLARKLTSLLSRQITSADVLHGATVAALAAEERSEEVALPTLSCRVHAGPGSNHPVSWNQSQMLTVHLVEGATAAYNMPRLYRIRGRLEPERIDAALRRIVERHVVLRSTYEVDGDGGAFLQRVHAVFDTVLRSHAGDEEGERLLIAEATRPFDLLAGAHVMRAGIADDASLLLLNVHHIAYDGASIPLLLCELGSLVRQTNEPPPLHVQYLDFVAWQHEAVPCIADTSGLYWRQHLREGALSVLALPLDYLRPTTPTTGAGDTVRVRIPSGVVRRVEDGVAKADGATLFHAALAMWAALLGRVAGQKEVVVGSPYHGRDAGGTEHLIGYFVNMLPLRLEVSPTMLPSVRKASVDGMKHALYPYQRLVHDLASQTRDSALFQTMLTWSGDDNWDAQDSESVFDPCARLTGTSKFDVSLEGCKSEGGVEQAVTYNTDLFAPGTMQRNATQLAEAWERFPDAADTLRAPRASRKQVGWYEHEEAARRVPEVRDALAFPLPRGRVGVVVALHPERTLPSDVSNETVVPVWVIVDDVPTTWRAGRDELAETVLQVLCDDASGGTWTARRGTDGVVLVNQGDGRTVHANERVRRAFAEVLRRAPADVDDHATFFSMGGNSMMTLTLSRLLSRALQRSVTVHDVLEHPTVGDMSVHVAATQETDAPRSRKGDVHPVSWNQAQLLTFHALHGATAVYNVIVRLRVHGALHADRLRVALDRVVVRHAVLRTTYEHGPAGSFLQRVHREALPGRWQPPDPDQGFDLFAHESVIRCNLDAHALQLTVHHVATDAKSMRLLLRDLAAAYQKCEVHLPSLEAQYTDFAGWQREELPTTLASSRAYWRAHLNDGDVPTLELPTDAPRTDTQSFHGMSLDVDVRFPTTHLATPFQVALALWSQLMCAHSAQAEVVVGTPYHGRDMAFTDDLVGYFVNILALRIAVPRRATRDDLFAHVHEVMQTGLRHARMPFHQLLQEELPSHRGDPSRNALFQTLFAWQEDEEDDGGWDGLWSRLPSLDRNVSKMDVSLYASDTGRCRVEYCTDLFAEGSAARMAHRLTALCDTASVLSADETETLRRFTDTAVSFPSALCLQDLVVAQAMRTCDAPAVSEGEHGTSYAQLCALAFSVATWLHCDGSECVVALRLRRSREQIVGVLGALCAMCAYLPMDMRWPAQRCSFVARDVGCRHLLVHSDIEEVWFEGDCLAMPVLPQRGVVPSSTSLPQCLAYVMYTSGSTGTPKGVMVEHAGVVNLLHATRSRYPIEETWPVALSTVYVFDVFVHVLFSTLGVLGGECVLLDLLEMSERERVVFVAGVPSVLSVVSFPPTVAHVDAAGEALTLAVREALKPEVCLYNYFGPTEASVYASGTDVPSPERIASIGKPLANVNAYVVVDGLQPIGVWGELLLGGIQLARGYLNRTEKTATTFVAYGDERVYKTGDRVRWYDDGALEYGGRLDFQVKLRGQRLELGEIEHALRARPEVVDAVVLLRDDALVAYVHPTLDLTWSRHTTLPTYMVPKIVMHVETWPRTASGKIDRRRLPPPPVSDRSTTVAPRTERERTLHNAFASVLGLPNVSVEASFFDLGGTSLKALVLVKQIAQTTGCVLAVAHVLTHPSVAALAKDRFLSGCLVWLSAPQPTVPQDAVLCVHDFTGQLWAYRRLAAVLGNACIGVACTEHVLDACEGTRDIGREYATQVAALWPAGAVVRLVGYSAGCAIAQHIAVDLEGLGFRTRVVLLDGDDAGHRSWNVERAIDRLRSGEHADPIGRLGAMLGPQGTDVACRLARLRDDPLASSPPVQRAGTADTTSPHPRHRLPGGHFDVLLEHAEYVSAFLHEAFAA